MSHAPPPPSKVRSVERRGPPSTPSSNADHAVSELPTQFQVVANDRGLAISGEIDAHTAPELRSAAHGVLARRPDIRIDMSEVTFIDSSGLGVLISITEAARHAGGDLVVVAPSRAVVRLLELSGLTEHIHVGHQA